MARTAEQYKKQLQSLLPKGKLWNRDESSILTKLLHGKAEELARIEERIENLLEEKDVRTTTELITEHEADFGIPEEGEELQTTVEARREELLSKLIAVGQQDKGYFEDISEAFGYDIVIEEFQPFWAGFGVAGFPCGDQFNLFYWKVGIDVDSVTESIEVNISKLISRINRLKPGHTIVLFDWYDAPFNRGFGRGFRRFYHYDNYWVELEFSRDFDSSFTNAYDYYGVNYIGSFDYAFNLAFDRRSGGEYIKDEFGAGFTRPS